LRSEECQLSKEFWHYTAWIPKYKQILRLSPL